MAGVEIKRKVRITRKEAGERLIALGKAMTQAPESELHVNGDSIKFTVADDVDWEFELEVDGNEVELEIELKWSQSPVAAPIPPPPAAKRARTSHRGDAKPRKPTRTTLAQPVEGGLPGGDGASAATTAR